MNDTLSSLSRNSFLVCPVCCVLHVSGLRNPALHPCQAERVFRETSETLAPGNGRGTAGGDAVYHGFQRRGGGGREDGELP